LEKQQEQAFSQQKGLRQFLERQCEGMKNRAEAKKMQE
jgi:hypothetical protein